MAEPSAMAGVAQGTIFYHFKTKEKLFTSIPKHFKISIIDEFERYMDKRRFEAGPDMVEGAVLFHLYPAGAMQDRFLLLHRRQEKRP